MAIYPDRCPTVATCLIILLAGTANALGAPSLVPKFPPIVELSSLDGSSGFVLRGIDEDDRSGASVSSAGDVNGDGFDDFLIGAYSSSPNGLTNAGRAFVIFGSPTIGDSGSLDLDLLHGSNGFVINGSIPHHAIGFSMSSAGDINADGYADIFIGAPDTTLSGNEFVGKVYIVFGAPDIGAPGWLDISALNGTDGFVVEGLGLHHSCGWSVSDSRDVNGDGIDDLVIGAPGVTSSGQAAAGAAYIVFGGQQVGHSGVIDLAALDGMNGFAVLGTHENDLLGWSACSAGDFNGDGLHDILIGAFSVSPDGRESAGATYIVFGRHASLDGPFPAAVAASSLDGANGLAIHGIDPGDWSGRSVSSAGDVNGDGADDVLIGAVAADPNGNIGAGECYVVLGKVTAIGGPFPPSIELSSLNGVNGFVMAGINPGDSCGSSVASAGDINHDGYDDIAIGARNADPGGRSRAGESYIVFGGPSVGASGHLDLVHLNGVNGFVVQGIQVDDLSGHSISAAGDVNNDGVDDLIIGAPFADSTGSYQVGETYVILGRSQRIPHFCPADIDGDAHATTNDLVILAGNFGATVSPGTGGDFDENGLVDTADFVIFADGFGCAP